MGRVAGPVMRVLTAVRAHPRWTTLALAAVASLLSVLLVDRPLALRLRAGLDADWRGFFTVLTDVGLAGHWYVLAVAGWAWSRLRASAAHTVAAWEHWRGWARSWGFMVVAMLTSGIAIHVLKFIFGRYRPKHLFDPDGAVYAFLPFSGEQGFPSGHSQAIWAACLALAILFPAQRFWLFALAAGVAFSRAVIGQHFLADVIMGSVVGILVTLWVRDRYEARAPLTVSR